MLLGGVVVKGVRRQNKRKQVGVAGLNGGNECGIGLPCPRISMSSSNLIGLGTNLGSCALGQVWNKMTEKFQSKTPWLGLEQGNKWGWIWASLFPPFLFFNLLISWHFQGFLYIFVILNFFIHNLDVRIFHPIFMYLVSNMGLMIG